MSAGLFWFVVGLGLGSSLTGLVLNGRYGRTLDDIEDRFHAMVAEHDHITRGLISRIHTLEADQ